MSTGQFLWGLSNAVLVFAVSGAFWLGLGLGPAALAVGVLPWLLVLTVMFGGGALLVRSALAMRRRSGFRRSDLRRADPSTRRILTGFRIIGLVETALVASAVLICAWFERPDLVWPAIGIAVSVHFAPIAWLFDVKAYYVTAAVGIAVSLGAIVAPLGESRLIWTGAAMAAVMWASAIYVIQSADALATRGSDALPPPAH